MCVALEQLRAVGAGEVREVREQADRRELHQERHHLVEHERHAAEPRGDRLALLTEQRHRNAEEHREHDERQNMRARNHEREVLDRERADDLLADAHVRGGFARGLRRSDLNRRIHAENSRDDEHVSACNGGRHDEKSDGENEQLADLFRVRNVRNRACNREKDQRHEQYEQHIQPELADWVQYRRFFAQRKAQNRADDNERDQYERLTIGRFFLFRFCVHIHPSASLFDFPSIHTVLVWILQLYHLDGKLQEKFPGKREGIGMWGVYWTDLSVE